MARRVQRHARADEAESQEEPELLKQFREKHETSAIVAEHHDRIRRTLAFSSRRAQTPVFAAPGTMEEETIDEEEADALHYEASSDEGYDEFEEETQAGPDI